MASMYTPRSYSRAEFLQEYQRLLEHRKTWLSEKNLSELERLARYEEVRDQALLNVSERRKASRTK